MKCILCVKEFGNNTNFHLLIYSTKGKELEAQHVIEKHFWLQPDEMDNDKSLICRSCWKVALNFHKFYIRIENVHKSLQQMDEESVFIKSEAEIVYCTSFNNQMKEEETVDNTTITIQQIDEIKQFDTNIDLESQPKRRGRPRKRSYNFEELVSENHQKSTVCNEDTIAEVEETNEKNEIENVPLSSLKKAETSINLRRGQPRKVKKELKPFAGYRTEEPIDKTASDVDEISPDDTDSNYDSESANNTECKEYVLIKKTPPTHKSIEFDKIIEENFKLVCCLCENIPANFSELEKHYRIEHNTRGYVRCCGKKFLKRGLLVDHIYTHQNSNYFTCKKCNKVLSSRRTLDEHVKRHEMQRNRDYQCEICKKSYFNHVVYLRHLKLHAPEEEKTVHCPQCPKTFVSKYYMTQHLKLVHLNMYAKVCDICGKSIRGSEAFQRHLQQHDGIKPPPIKCKLCGFELSSKYALARHMKRRHTEKYSQSQVCPICSKISPSLMAHKSHMKNVHTMERKHACTLCDKAYKRLQNLKEHMTQHTGEVLFSCAYCPKTFNTSNRMYDHRKRKHPKEWQEIQNKRFQNTSSAVEQEVKNMNDTGITVTNLIPATTLTMDMNIQLPGSD